MKTNRNPFGPATVDAVCARSINGAPRARGASLLWLACLLLLAAGPGRAAVSEPDNLLYGTITIQGQSVTSEYLDVVVEARRGINGPAVASYRMGDNAQVGNLYYLKIPTESLPPVADTNASLAGDALYIAVTDSTGLWYQQPYTVGGRGSVQRLDFGSALVVDADHNGLPDAWERLYYGSAGQNPNALTPSGQTILQNYVAGTNDFYVMLTLSNGQKWVSFYGLRAAGTGYEGMTRFYSLLFTTNLRTTWTGVSNYTDLIGDNAVVTYPVTGTNSPALYRVQTRLQ